jgi:hypothetical protein
MQANKNKAILMNLWEIKVNCKNLIKLPSLEFKIKAQKLACLSILATINNRL